jgi:hypothetical protein
MSTDDYIDIEDVLDRLAELEALHKAEDPSFEKASGVFIQTKGHTLAGLLLELAHWRDQNEGGLPHYAESKRAMVEGYSDVSAEDALAKAVAKAGQFYGPHHEVTLTLQKLMALPGGGHRAQMEVHLTPFSLEVYPHMAAPDVDALRHHNKTFRASRKAEAELPAHMVFEHFASIRSQMPPNIPASLLVNITDAALLNKMIEKQFFSSAKPLTPSDLPSPTPDNPVKVMVRTKKPEVPDPD